MVRAASGTLFAGKPCSFNTIAGVTGTRRRFDSRTKEQGLGVGDRAIGGMRVVPENGPSRKRRVPQNNRGCQGRAAKNHPVCTEISQTPRPGMLSSRI
jgi:hypothetical protein